MRNEGMEFRGMELLDDNKTDAKPIRTYFLSFFPPCLRASVVAFFFLRIQLPRTRWRTAATKVAERNTRPMIHTALRRPASLIRVKKALTQGV